MFRKWSRVQNFPPTMCCVMRHWDRNPCKSIQMVEGDWYFVDLLHYKLVNEKGRVQVVLYCWNHYTRQYFCFCVLNFMLFHFSLVSSCFCVLFVIYIWFILAFLFVFVFYVYFMMAYWMYVYFKIFKCFVAFIFWKFCFNGGLFKVFVFKDKNIEKQYIFGLL